MRFIGGAESEADSNRNLSRELDMTTQQQCADAADLQPLPFDPHNFINQADDYTFIVCNDAAITTEKQQDEYRNAMGTNACRIANPSPCAA